MWGRPTRIDVGGGFAAGEVLDEDGNVMVVCSTRTIVVASTPGASAVTRVAASAVENFSAAVNFDDYLDLQWRDEEGGGGGDAVDVQLKDPSTWRNEFGMLLGGPRRGSRLTPPHTSPTRTRTAGMRTVYLRPCTSKAPVTVTARLRHNGSRLAVADCAGRSEDGTLCTVSTLTARHILVSPATEERH